MRSRRPLGPCPPRPSHAGPSRSGHVTGKRRPPSRALASCRSAPRRADPVPPVAGTTGNPTDSVPLVDLESLQLHLDEAAGVELELLGTADGDAVRVGGEGRVFDHHALVTLDERIDEEL